MTKPTEEGAASQAAGDYRRRIELLRNKAEQAAERAATMLGIPNDIDRAEGYAAGLQHALWMMEEPDAR